MAYMKQLANRIQTLQETLPSAVASHLLSMNNSKGGNILLIGPEEGVSPSISSTDSVPTILSIKGELSHLEGVSYISMSTAISTKANNMRADFVLRNKFESWLSGVSPQCLWLPGKSARTISALVYRVGIDRMRPIVATVQNDILCSFPTPSSNRRRCRGVRGPQRTDQRSEYLNKFDASGYEDDSESAVTHSTMCDHY